jgi:hypothetical protein
MNRSSRRRAAARASNRRIDAKRFIQRCENWRLYWRFRFGDWDNFKLENHRRAKKRNYWFGWNGHRLSRCRDMALLREYEPDVYSWLLEALREHRQPAGDAP